MRRPTEIEMKVYGKVKNKRIKLVAEIITPMIKNVISFIKFNSK